MFKPQIFLGGLITSVVLNACGPSDSAQPVEVLSDQAAIHSTSSITLCDQLGALATHTTSSQTDDCTPAGAVDRDSLEIRNGVLFERGEAAPFRGVAVRYHPNGLLAYWAVQSLNDNHIAIDLGHWYPNGQLMERSHWIDGQLDGFAERYFETGQLRSRGRSRDGLPHGDFEAYYQNGQLERRGQFDEGRPVGEWRYYREDGTVSDQDILPSEP
jgi:antitoxin component YwqK of YwqJK toxin-antitoxin module